MEVGDLGVFKFRVAMATVCQSVFHSPSAANSYDGKSKCFKITGNDKPALTEIVPLLSFILKRSG